MPRHPLLALAMALALLCQGGCSLYREPRVEIADARLSGITDDGMVITFDLLAENVNDDELPLRTVRYELWLDGQRVFEGVRSAEATLARRSTQRLILPAAVAFSPDFRLPEGAVEYRVSGEVKYITPGRLAEVLYDSGIPAPTSSFDAEGTLDLAAGVARFRQSQR